MKIVKIGTRGNMFIFFTVEGWVINLYVVQGEKNVFVIDTGCGSDHALQLRQFAEQHFAGKPIVVVNTHYHWDHIMGNHIFDDCNIIAHRNIMKHFVEHWEACKEKHAKFVEGETKCRVPNILLEGSINFVDDQIELFCGVGHTDDGICLFDKKDKVLYVGDNIGDSVLQPLPYLECGKDEYMQFLQHIKGLDFDLLVSGHNIILDKSFVDKIIEALQQSE